MIEMKNKMDIIEVLDILAIQFKDRDGDLDFRNPFELLIAVILSAQTTDKAVNKVTPALFEVYPDPHHLSKANPEEIQGYIKTIGLYKNKSKYIVECSQDLVLHFKGEVPKTLEELVSLKGVGRKTANVVLATAFDIPAIAVDTHIARVSVLLGIAKPKDTVLQIERKLQRAIPKERWAKAHLHLLLFGRYHATAHNEIPVYDLLLEMKENQAK